uniref:Uncharacterized protein n=1 Tax=Triticum urartu TaxID=4572 RepID=A0A8R7U8Z1_TRIUA
RALPLAAPAIKSRPHTPLRRRRRTSFSSSSRSLIESKRSSRCFEPPPCRTRWVTWWTSTSPGSARPPTGSSRPRTTPLSRSTLVMLMRMASMMAASPPLLSLGSSVLRVMLMAPWTGCGRRGRLRSSSSRCC